MLRRAIRSMIKRIKYANELSQKERELFLTTPSQKLPLKNRYKETLPRLRKARQLLRQDRQLGIMLPELEKRLKESGIPRYRFGSAHYVLPLEQCVILSILIRLGNNYGNFSHTNALKTHNSLVNAKGRYCGNIAFHTNPTNPRKFHLAINWNDAAEFSRFQHQFPNLTLNSSRMEYAVSGEVSPELVGMAKHYYNLLFRFGEESNAYFNRQRKK